jgi:hypothetical protein
MKKLIFLLALLFMVPAPAQAANLITLTEPSHRQYDGKFFDDQLATSLMPSGKLGKSIYELPNGYRVWHIDPSLIDEVQAMAAGYKLVNGKDGLGQTIAKDWLARLIAVSRYDQVTAIAYGNPSGYWIHRLMPNYEKNYLQASGTKLGKFYGRQVYSPTSYESYNYFSLTSYQSLIITDAISSMKNLDKYLDVAGADAYKFRAAAMLNPDLNNHWRNLLTKDLAAESDIQNNKIRLAPGRFTISASKQDLPITVINDFPTPANLVLNISEMNGRIQAVNKISVKLDAKSRVQVKIPVEVFSSGDSSLSVGIADEKGKQIGDYVMYPISIRVISPVATWITYLAALILFFSALIQSIRRIRKRER